ncbi:hypothetical protein SAMN05444156_0366 [Verrucomicrobium sp. GAS474]|uniref:EamA family transporter n=1 Tax=Verrucomicrobium sp. GAS474 TaxID=1882831 RepID=UPI00087ABB18|nr:EamA family transporter [Verrucomicrobium sp. GAS474]SDT87984.1 hypothetical protein SAMN05444156_0366 [Verrucomicrobium sp. GAS474]
MSGPGAGETHSGDGASAAIPVPVLTPYFHLLLGALLVTASELLLRRGAAAVPDLGWSGLTGLTSAWVWVSVLCYIGSFVCWLRVLSRLPLVVAFNLMNIVHVLVPLGSALFLHERISLLRWSGIALVLVGVWTIAKPLMTLEEKL